MFFSGGCVKITPCMILKKWREREREKHGRESKTLIGCLLHAPYWELAPYWEELNQQPFGAWNNGQTTEPHWPGEHYYSF